MKNESKQRSAPDTPSKGQKVTSLLRADHKLVNSLFADYEKARSPAKKKTLVAQICSELTVHAQLEEEIFYPAFKQALKDKELIPEPTVAHETLRDLRGSSHSADNAASSQL